MSPQPAVGRVWNQWRACCTCSLPVVSKNCHLEPPVTIHKVVNRRRFLLKIHLLNIKGWENWLELRFVYHYHWGHLCLGWWRARTRPAFCLNADKVRYLPLSLLHSCWLSTWRNKIRFLISVVPSEPYDSEEFFTACLCPWCTLRCSFFFWFSVKSQKGGSVILFSTPTQWRFTAGLVSTSDNIIKSVEPHT